MRSCPWTTISLPIDQSGNISQYESRSSYWTVAFVRYNNPIGAYSSDQDKTSTKPLLIVENDAISVQISAPKNHFGKMASISLKVTNINYSVAVNNGDWMFIWMHERKEDADRIVNQLTVIKDSSASFKNKNSTSNGILNNYDSGLKFMGRVTSSTQTDKVSNGVRQSFSMIQGQAFLDMASSIYYFESVFKTLGTEVTPGGVSSINDLDIERRVFQNHDGLAPSMHAIAEDFYKTIAQQGIVGRTPDLIIALVLILSMGSQKSAAASSLYSRGDTPNKPTVLPADVFRIMGRPIGQELWQLYQLYVGVQQYNPGSGKNWYKNFAPNFPANLNNNKANEANFIFKTEARCKGAIPDINLLSTGQSLWETLNNYLNPICNEMYTALKLDHNGKISPIITVREIPLSTGISQKILSSTDKIFRMSTPTKEASPDDGQNDGVTDNKMFSMNRSAFNRLPSNSLSNSEAGNSSVQAGSLSANQNTARTYYGNLPRWVIHDSVIIEFNWETDEADRVNFIQIFGTNGNSQYYGDETNTPDRQMENQLRLGNYAQDDVDIQRHGLRVFTAHTIFDMATNDQVTSLAPLWAAMNADWKFNGHMKAKGNVTIIGTSKPIAEGDNVEIRGILFHIDSVSHQASLSGNGTKQWFTTLTISNGVLANSLDDFKSVPRYIGEVQENKYAAFTPGAAYTQVQERISGEAKDPKGNKSTKWLSK